MATATAIRSPVEPGPGSHPLEASSTESETGATPGAIGDDLTTEAEDLGLRPFASNMSIASAAVAIGSGSASGSGQGSTGAPALIEGDLGALRSPVESVYSERTATNPTQGRYAHSSSASGSGTGGRREPSSGAYSDFSDVYASHGPTVSTDHLAPQNGVSSGGRRESYSHQASKRGEEEEEDTHIVQQVCLFPTRGVAFV